MKKDRGGFLGNDIKWNFTKFLVSRNGTILLEPLGLTYTQYIAMMVMWEYKSISIRDVDPYKYLCEILSREPEIRESWSDMLPSNIKFA